jgi:hypothetical protein
MQVMRAAAPVACFLATAAFGQSAGERGGDIAGPALKADVAEQPPQGVRTPPRFDGAWFGDRLKPAGDVHVIAIDVVILGDHLTGGNTYLKDEALRLGQTSVAHNQFALNVDGAAHGVGGAREFHQNAVTGVLHNATAVPCDTRVNYCAAAVIEGGERTRLVRFHAPAEPETSADSTAAKRLPDAMAMPLNRPADTRARRKP